MADWIGAAWLVVLARSLLALLLRPRWWCAMVSLKLDANQLAVTNTVAFMMVGSWQGYRLAEWLRRLAD